MNEFEVNCVDNDISITDSGSVTDYFNDSLLDNDDFGNSDNLPLLLQASDGTLIELPSDYWTNWELLFQGLDTGMGQIASKLTTLNTNISKVASYTKTTMEDTTELKTQITGLSGTVTLMFATMLFSFMIRLFCHKKGV